MALKGIGIVCPPVAGARRVATPWLVDGSENRSELTGEGMRCVAANGRSVHVAARGGATAVVLVDSAFALRKNGNLMFPVPCCGSQTTFWCSLSTHYATAKIVRRKLQTRYCGRQNLRFATGSNPAKSYRLI